MLGALRRDALARPLSTKAQHATIASRAKTFAFRSKRFGLKRKDLPIAAPTKGLKIVTITQIAGRGYGVKNWNRFKTHGILAEWNSLLRGKGHH